MAQAAAARQGPSPLGETITLPGGIMLTSNGTGGWDGLFWTETRYPGLQAELWGQWATVNGNPGLPITPMGIALDQDQLDFIYDNNNAIGLGIGTLEPGFAAAWDAVRVNPAAYTRGAANMAKGLGAGWRLPMWL